MIEKYGYNPDESKADTKNARKQAIEKRSLPTFERMMQGTKTSQLSHMEDIYNIKIGMGDLGYSPNFVNQTLLKNVDPYISTLYEKRDKLMKYKPKGWEKALEEINQKGMDAAAATRGYKSFTIMNPDGTTFKYGGNPLRSLDPFGEYEGKSLQESFPNKIKRTELSERQYFPDKQKREVFLENAMELHKAQQTGNLEEIKKINQDLFDLKFNDEKTFNEVDKKINELESVSDVSDDLLCTIGRSNKAKFYEKDRLKRALKADGGRIGFKKGHTPECIEAGKKKIEEGRIGPSELNAVEDSLKQSGKMTPAAQ